MAQNLQSDFDIPRIKSVYKGEDSLRYLGPLIWQLVPKKTKSLSSLKDFKSEIKKWVPHKCPCRLCKDFVHGLGYVNLF